MKRTMRVLIIGGTRFVALALENPQVVGRTHNMGHNQVLTVWGLAELVAQVMDHSWEILAVPTGRRQPTNPFAKPSPLVCDLRRIERELGYGETGSLEEGRRRTVEWLVAHPPTPETWGLGRYMEYDAFDYAAEDAAAS
jgi:nucleoside-diphosphate-sugar epimerase